MKDLHRISRCTRHFMVTGASSSALLIELTQLAKLMFGAWPIRYSFRRTARWASSKRLQAPTEVHSENRGPKEDSSTISLSCLKDDFNDVFKIFSEVLRAPEFRADKLDLAKREAFDSISRRNDEVNEITHREAVQLAYGPTNPYARIPEYATINAITRQDLVIWHDTYVHPNNIIIGIV